jgi:hypothetical protein
MQKNLHNAQYMCSIITNVVFESNDPRVNSHSASRTMLQCELLTLGAQDEDPLASWHRWVLIHSKHVPNVFFTRNCNESMSYSSMFLMHSLWRYSQTVSCVSHVAASRFVPSINSGLSITFGLAKLATCCIKCDNRAVYTAQKNPDLITSRSGKNVCVNGTRKTDPTSMGSIWLSFAPIKMRGFDLIWSDLGFLPCKRDTSAM